MGYKLADAVITGRARRSWQRAGIRTGRKRTSSWISRYRQHSTSTVNFLAAAATSAGAIAWLDGAVS